MAGVDELIAKLDEVRADFYALRLAMQDRTEHFNRILLAQCAGAVAVTVSLLIIISAVMPGVPLLRIYERNQAKSGEIVRQLNCNVFWSNDKRVAGCEDVYRVLDGLPRVGGGK